MVTLILIILGLLLSVLGFEYGDSWPCSFGPLTGWLGTLISALSAVRQYRESTPHQFIFTEATWRPVGSDFQLEVPTKRHSKGTAATTVIYRATPSGFEEIICGLSVTSSGNVLVSANLRFSGKAVIK